MVTGCICICFLRTKSFCSANVQIYLLEKSRIISQAQGERNYHVFYYLLDGGTDEEVCDLHLMQPQKYHYLNQVFFLIQIKLYSHSLSFRTISINPKALTRRTNFVVCDTQWNLWVLARRRNEKSSRY